MSRPYVILTPQYNHKIGGVRVLHHLMIELINAGYPCRIVNNKKDKAKPDEIAIYPEIYSGNPLEATRVARWVLYRPGELGGDKVYDESELVFVFDHMFLDSVKNKVYGMLNLPYLELDLFKVTNYGDREATCYYEGKGKVNQPIPIDSIEITKSYPQTREGLADLFNRCKTFYCFDPMTIMIYEAPLCGCPTVLLNNYEAHKMSSLELNGVCDKEEDIDQARQTMHLVKEDFIQLKERFKEQLQQFIEITQEEI